MLSCQKGEFQIETGVHYLNCAYLSPLMRRVEEAGIAGLARKRSPTGFPASAFYDDCDRLRTAFATLVTGTPGRVAIMPSVSYGIASAARNTPIRADQRIVILGEQFPSNVYAWRRRAGETGCEIRTVGRPCAPPCGALWNERILDAIDASTAVVAMPATHWTDGTRFDLEAIGERARAVGAMLVVDGSQSVGAVPFDVSRVRPDALICCGYKWLLGPYSIALGAFGERFDDGVPLEETWIAREGSGDFQGLVDYEERYQGGAIRYDMGERSNFIQVPMLIEALETLDAWGVSRVREYCADLLAGLADELRGRGWPLEEDEWRGGHILGVVLPEGWDLRALHARLEDARVFASLRGATLRLSPNVYNDPEDIAALRQIILETHG